MLKFSEKEYETLRKEVSEIRTSITRYIGLIITISGLSGLIFKFIFSEKFEPLKVLIVLFIILAVLTALFEIVWYKFKSHNRFVGYIQLLMQEQNLLCMEELAPEQIEKKAYIFEYKELLEDQRENNESIKWPENIFAWELIMARLNNSNHQKKWSVFKSKKNPKDERDEILRATSKKSKFVFSLSNKYKYDKKLHNECDTDFFQQVILPLYGKRNYLIKDKGEAKQNIFSRLGWLKRRRDKFKNRKRNSNIQEMFRVGGWTYPKIITNIVFIMVVLMFVFSIFLVWFERDAFFGELEFKKSVFMFGLMVGMFLLFCVWFFRYVRNLGNVIHGKYSIDGYCWTLFIFRVQKLNSLGFIPIYFSRSFIRFFKSVLIAEAIKEGTALEKKLKKGKKGRFFDSYKLCIENMEPFKKDEHKELHKEVLKYLDEHNYSV